MALRSREPQLNHSLNGLSCLIQSVIRMLISSALQFRWIYIEIVWEVLSRSCAWKHTKDKTYRILFSFPHSFLIPSSIILLLYLHFGLISVFPFSVTPSFLSFLLFFPTMFFKKLVSANFGKKSDILWAPSSFLIPQIILSRHPSLWLFFPPRS